MTGKYWKGLIGDKEGQCGVYEDENLPSGSIETTKAVYDAWVAALPAPVVETRFMKLKKVSDGTITDYEVIE